MQAVCVAKSIVLYYHHVSPKTGDYTHVALGELERQLEWATASWRPNTLQAIAHGESGLGISFDDGYADTLSALKILAKFKVSATFFVLPTYAGKTSSFNRNREVAQHLSFGDLRRLQSLGHSVASHGMTHRDLTKLSNIELRREFAKSRELLESSLDTEVSSFAYPYGLCDQRVVATCAEFFSQAWSTSSQKAERAGKSAHALSRAYLIPNTDGAYDVSS